jgi:HEAT repeat protein
MLTKNQSRIFGIPFVPCVVFVAPLFATFPLLADGLFVTKWKWNKEVDINEPTQKAIILYDAGREDMLLQVKYEGRVSDFGWLVPVPTLPKIEKGSMGPFYELSPVTQREFGVSKGFSMLGAADARLARPAVEVIEIKTVGAYEVAVLSASETGSLERWLKSHGYSIPEGKSEIVEDYVRKGWYFVAAKIDLNRGTGFKMAAATAPKDDDAAAHSEKQIQKKLASGELHPLLLSFDTPQCVFPLKISAAAGKPSEVSLYLLSAAPLLNRSLFDEAMEKLDERKAQWMRDKPRRQEIHRTQLQNMRAMSMAYQMYAADFPDDVRTLRGRRSNLPPGAVAALVREQVPRIPDESLDESFYASPEELLHCMRMSPQQLTKTTKGLPRLKGREWYLTKVVRTFAAGEMRDLEFEPAIPVLVTAMQRPAGRIAAEVLSQFGVEGFSALETGCKASDSVARANAIAGLAHLQGRNLVEPLLPLLNDDAPMVRLYAVRAVANNWDARFGEPVRNLFRDPYWETRSTAVGCLCIPGRSGPKGPYLELLKDPKPNVKMCALSVMLRLDRDAIPAEPLTTLIRDPRPEVQGAAAHILWQLNRDVVPRKDLLPLLGSCDSLTVNIGLKLIEGTGHVQPALPEPLASEREQQLKARALTSTEAVFLTTNQLASARLMGLHVLQRNADSKAVELTLPLLSDSNEFVRGQAFVAMAAITGKEISKDDPVKWEQWWASNKDTFTVR